MPNVVDCRIIRHYDVSMSSTDCKCGGCPGCGKQRFRERLRKFVEKFCQEGANKGKPGPCPGAKRGTGAVAVAKKRIGPKATVKKPEAKPVTKPVAPVAKKAARPTSKTPALPADHQETVNKIKGLEDAADNISLKDFSLAVDKLSLEKMTKPALLAIAKDADFAIPARGSQKVIAAFIKRDMLENKKRLESLKV